MGIRVEWVNDRRLEMVWQFDPDWTWDDWHATTQAALALRADNPDPPHVYVILNLHPTRVIPKNPLTHARRSLGHADPRDTIILVGGRFIRFLAATFKEIYPASRKRFYIVGSFEEALKLAADLREASASV